MATATCPKHANAPVLGTCSRCGAFGCTSCLESSGIGLWQCADCRMRSVSDLPSLGARARLAVMGLYATGALDLFSSGLDAAVPSEEGVGAIFSGLLAIGYLAVFILTIVLFCRWFHLSVRYAAARGVQLGVTPAGAVGSWFIPFVNLVRPFQIAKGLLEGAGSSSSSREAWQALWIIGNIAGNLSMRMDSKPLGLVSSLLMVGAAFLGAKVVGEITEGYEKRASG